VTYVNHVVEDLLAKREVRGGVVALNACRRGPMGGVEESSMLGRWPLLRRCGRDRPIVTRAGNSEE
jgi:hypothetical protein